MVYLGILCVVGIIHAGYIRQRSCYSFDHVQSLMNLSGEIHDNHVLIVPFEFGYYCES